MSNNPYIVIIYAGATNTGANSIIADHIAKGIKDSGMNVLGPIDINFINSKEKEDLVDKIASSSGIIIGSGVYNGNIEPTLTDFFNKFAGAGFESSFLLSKVAGQFSTAGDCGTGAQLVLNSLARLMQTFGANIINGGSWQTAQGIIGIVKEDKETGKGSFTSKDVLSNSIMYGERIGRIGLFFQDNYNKSMSLPEPDTGKTCKEFAPECHSCPDHKNNSCTIWLILFITMTLLFLILLFIKKFRLKY